jgi:hypothetical protein
MALKSTFARGLLPLALVVCAPVVMAQEAAAAQEGAAVGCARQFEQAQRIDMESFRDYDAETFRAIHHPQAVTVFASGARREGVDAIMAALASHFRNREGRWSWVERFRHVDGCRTAYILYETVYELPSIGYRQRALTGVTYTHDGNGWLGIADQGTPLP